MPLDLTGSNLFFVLVLFGAGLFCIMKGGDLFVDAATWIAESTGIPKFIIGATVVSFATTMPELLVSLFSAFEGNADIAVGNAVLQRRAQLAEPEFVAAVADGDGVVASGKRRNEQPVGSRDQIVEDFAALERAVQEILA